MGFLFISMAITCIILSFYTLRLYLKKINRQAQMNMSLLEKRIQEFDPEPLVETIVDNTTDTHEMEVSNEDPEVIDLTKTNYLNMLNETQIQQAAEECIRNYGVGTCGPRGFYGTTDLHLKLEQKLAQYLGVEEAIVYAYSFTTISSSIASFCRAYDTIYCDEKTNFAIKQGAQAAKSKVVYFPHNDVDGLKNLVYKISATKNNRRFLILEGIYAKTGKICPLPDFLKVAKEFCMHVFLDETISLATLGKTGRGLTEYFHLQPDSIDMIMGSLDGALGAAGGFCAGSTRIVEHQRLSSCGYTFSASLPTYLCQASLKALEMIGEKPKCLKKVANSVHEWFLGCAKLEMYSDPDSPIKIFGVKTKTNKMDNIKILCDYCKSNKVYIISKSDAVVLNVSVELYFNRKKFEKLICILEEAVTQIS